ncbi:MAG: hypothetical protein K2K96_10680 [Lachnospiraceae bacterium]|nr:hypothetical protein [Lachnospiraceae bacterium]
MFGYVLAVLGILAVGALAGSIIYVIYRARKISKAVFGTVDILEGFKQQEEVYNNTAKSVSGMTSVELPKIMKDFPEFSWSEWKKICENTLRAYLEAIENHSLTYLKDASDAIKQQADLIIGEEKKLGITECFDQLHIHRTEISRYEKKDGICKIKIQSALQYYYSKISEEKGKMVDNKKQQCRYDMELVFVQDMSKVEDDLAYDFVGNCPNCGAPMVAVGSTRRCQYCGTEVKEAYNTRVWTLHRIDKVK